MASKITAVQIKDHPTIPNVKQEVVIDNIAFENEIYQRLNNTITIYTICRGYVVNDEHGKIYPEWLAYNGKPIKIDVWDKTYIEMQQYVYDNIETIIKKAYKSLDKSITLEPPTEEEE